MSKYVYRVPEVGEYYRICLDGHLNLRTTTGCVNLCTHRHIECDFNSLNKRYICDRDGNLVEEPEWPHTLFRPAGNGPDYIIEEYLTHKGLRVLHRQLGEYLEAT